MGYSLGALLLAKYLAEEGTGTLPTLDSHRPLRESLARSPLAQPNTAPVHSATPHSHSNAAALPAVSPRASAYGIGREDATPAFVGRAAMTPDAAEVAQREAGGNGTASSQQASESSTDARLAAAVVVSSPYDMGEAARKIAKPWTMGWIYNLVLTFRCAVAQ